MTMVRSIKWTNPSVMRFAGNQDPITKIEESARSLVLKAMDAGWSGPPYDPIKLADFLKIEVRGRADIADARIISAGKGKLAIEFNPNRPRSRTRFTLAHEIAHSFFDDCGEYVRNREVRKDSVGDIWQLEMLCNIAAAELVMPIGSFRTELEDGISIERLMELRVEHDVSPEAILIRAAKLTELPCAMFCASRIEGGHSEGRYMIEYMIPSKSWPMVGASGFLASPSSVLAECTGVGFTAKSDERWPISKSSLHVECVGIFPHPDRKFPRVAGIIDFSDHHQVEIEKVQYLYGDALVPRGEGQRIVAHIVNDKTANWGGGGFAANLKRKSKEVHIDFVSQTRQSGELKLGNGFLTRASDDLSYFHMVAQKGYGPSSSPRIRYDALQNCLESLGDIAAKSSASVHMPRVGTGYAGGNWDVVEELLYEELISRGVPVSVYDLPPKAKSTNQMNLLD